MENKIPPSYAPSPMLIPGIRAHVDFGNLSLLKNAPTAVKMGAEYEVEQVYAVFDQHARRIGFVVKARYLGSSVSWYAVDNKGLVSSFQLLSRAAALPVLEVMAAGHLMTSGMSRAEVPA